jgi:mannose-6-phosphate isomerase-like protein (cupin superfamily)
MKLLDGGAAVIDREEQANTEGNRRFRVAISRAMGARDISQTISVYAEGKAPARRNPYGEEVLYVVRGTGGCYIAGHRYRLAQGTAVYVPPGSVLQIENPHPDRELEIVAVCCPEDGYAESGLSAVEVEVGDTAPILVVCEADRQPIPAGNRTFKLLVNHEIGCQQVTQFLGTIPPGAAPMHHHTYEEAIYVLEGEGTVHTESSSAPFQSGSSIYLPRGVKHCVENTGQTNVRLLGVFHPSGSPAVSYDD